MKISRSVIILILLVVLTVNVGQVFGVTESFSITPDEQKTFDIALLENQKIFFQIFVSGGENDDIRLKVIEKNTNVEYFNSIIRENKEDSQFGSPEFPAYKNEISNTSVEVKKLMFIFDNSLVSSSSKNVDFTYTVIEDSGAYFEQSASWSWIFELVVIICGFLISIIVIVIIVKKKKNKK